MSPTKKFLWTMVAIYAVGSVVGIVLFHSPNYSSQYVKAHGAEQARYHEITGRPLYVLHEERPLLNPIPPSQKEDFEFVEEYAARPEFKAEQRRIFLYNWYFKALNSFVFIALMVRFGKKPIMDFLGGQIDQIKTTLQHAEDARKSAERLAAEIKSKMAEWDRTHEQIQRDSDQRAAENLKQIREEFDEARKQLAIETDDRKQAEVYRASRAVREEVVTRTIQILEDRYRTEATTERLAANVDQFAKLMDTLS